MADMAAHEQQSWEDISSIETTRLDPRVADLPSRPQVVTSRPLAVTSQPLAPAQAVRAGTLTPWQKVARSVELANRDHLTYRARYQMTTEAGERIFGVPSRKEANRTRTVRQVIATGEWTCSCPAGAHGLPCGHIGAAAHLQQQIEQRMSEAGHSAQLRYLAMADWLERQGY